MSSLLNDPKLTAFALGELEGQEAIEMAKQIENDPQARQYVEDIQSSAQMISLEFEKDASASSASNARLSPGEREKIFAGAPFAKATSSIPFWKRWAFIAPTTGGVFAVAALIVFMRTTIDTHLIAIPDTQAPVTQSEMPEPQAPSQAYVKQGSGNISTHGPVESQAAPSAFGGSGVGISRGDHRARAMKGFQAPEFNSERYSNISENEWVRVADEALSTFSIDVDTASYSNVRRFLNAGTLPPVDAVRIEEMINYFKYDYPQPTDGRPFSVNTEIATAPWAPKHKLVRVGLKGRDVADAARPASNLVFLLDVSGSMEEPNKLPLVQKSMKLLADKMRSKDRVAIIVYAGHEAVVLESTSGDGKKKINDAIDQLTAGGGTNGSGGIQKAYEIAQKNFIKDGINRIVLATDGDFNVGTTSESELIKLVESKAKSGVFLTVLGFGTGNYNDSMMVKLADKGNGNHAYIDSLREAQKVLVEQAGGTLMTIAKDVKIQVEFNPRYVTSYRLIGYEKRMLNKEDFNDDKKDAGEIGAGHTVTALYEIVPAGVETPSEKPKIDELKYQQKPVTPEAPKANSDFQAPAVAKAGTSDELLTVKLRYKQPTGDTSVKFDVPVKNEEKSFEQASSDMKFATAVAGFGMILRDSKHLKAENGKSKDVFDLDQVIDLALSNSKINGRVDDTRLDLLDLARRTREIKKAK